MSSSLGHRAAWHSNVVGVSRKYTFPLQGMQRHTDLSTWRAAQGYTLELRAITAPDCSGARTATPKGSSFLYLKVDRLDWGHGLIYIATNS